MGGRSVRRPRPEQEVLLVVRPVIHPEIAKDPQDLFSPVMEVKSETWSFGKRGRREKTLVSP